MRFLLKSVMPLTRSKSLPTTDNDGGSDRKNLTSGRSVARILYMWTNYGKGWRSRWFLLRDGILSYSKIRRPENINSLSPSDDVRLIGDISTDRLSKMYSCSGRGRRKQHKTIDIVHLKTLSKTEQRYLNHQEMDKKDEKVEAVLHLLRKQSPLTLKQEKFCNRECVERFLKGKGDNVKKAAKQLISCLSWRQNVEIERLGAEEFSAELSDGVAYIAGHDGDSRPVIIFRFKNDYQKLRSEKQFSRLVAFTMETAISSMSKNAERSVVLLFDASFFRSVSVFANLLLATLKIIADNYPCRVYKAFIIDPPSFFYYIWKGLRPFVELSTVTTLISSLDYDEQLASSSSCTRSASLRFDASSIKSTATIGSASSRFAFTVSQNSLKPWYLSFTNTSPLNASKVSPLSARSVSFASPTARGFRDARPAACRKSLFPSTPLPEKTKTVSPYRKTPRPSFFQSPAMFFRGQKNVGGGEKSSREAFVPYLKFYRKPYDETAYRSKLRGSRGFVSVVSSHKRTRHVSLSQRF